MIYKHILLITFLNKPVLIFFCTQLNGLKYCDVTVTIYPQLFVCTHLNLYT